MMAEGCLFCDSGKDDILGLYQNYEMGLILAVISYIITQCFWCIVALCGHSGFDPVTCWICNYVEPLVHW